VEEIQKAKKAVGETLEKLSEDDLLINYPQKILPKETTTGFFLLHLLAHLDYHIGQINYLRRIL
jgi:hypothetical protein